MQVDAMMEQLEEEQRRRIGFQQLNLQRQVLRDTSNPFALDTEYFRKHYRLTPELAVILIQQVEGDITRARNSYIPAYMQVLIILRFLAEGAFQKGFAQDFNHPVSQATASRCIKTVINAINGLVHRYIVFPCMQNERQQIQQQFQETIRIPGIIGLIDCFLVTLKRPPENEEAFFNYKVGPSMNVQIIVDANYVIRNIRICPGSNNDRHIWQFSDAKLYLQNLRSNEQITAAEGKYYILRDSCYISHMLLTPILHSPPQSLQATYTSEHVNTRCRVEQTIGNLTGVWMVINRARKLYYRPQKVAQIINACAVLHNIRQHFRINYHAPVDMHDANLEIEIPADYEADLIERNRLIDLYYYYCENFFFFNM